MGKLKKEKHNHKLTDFLKVGIFSLVMLAPLISIGSKMAYVTFNKNAYKSYYGETINETYYKKINSNEQWNNNVIYNLTTSLITEEFVTDMTLNVNNYKSNTDNTSGFTMIQFYNTSNHGIIKLSGGGNNDTWIDPRAYTLNVNFNIISLSGNNQYILDNWMYKLQYNKDSYLDNAFEYAVNQLGETQIFAWTKNTAIYTPIETMTNGLGFNPDNNTLAILLTYWSLVTAVYVIMDIILFAFTKITHFTQN